MTAKPEPTPEHTPELALDAAYFGRWVGAAAQLFERDAARLTALDAAAGDGDHGANMVRGFGAVREAAAQHPSATPGELFSLAGTTLTNSVGGASGPLFGMALRRTGKRLGAAEAVTLPEFAAALRAGAEAVGKLGGAVPGDSTLLDALLPALDALDAPGSAEDAPDVREITGALSAASAAALSGAESTGAMQARKGRASYLGERSIGHEDGGPHSVVLLFHALVLAPDPAWSPRPAAAARAEEPTSTENAAATGGRVGVVLVSHSREVAEATAELAKAMVGSGDIAPVYAAGGTDDGRIGTSAERIHAAALKADEGKGVAVLCDMGSAVLTVQALLSGSDDRVLPAGTRIVDAPFVEGAVGVVVTASVGGDLDMVLAAGEDARNYRKG
ncbi:dihydroxyacetone kinase subunit DhaL [Streptomyces sp. N35]|uniref:dihydroxyacetone kinase subunit DhaL n=1 Tax=Streptomyces sp. N35 TaxID=2795730 RepID=UPI0018F722DF|nr:dihydroxyacetone kinase subunit DhaL [Streptomyces sp. N35]